jgi:hypothetical protein
MKIVHFRNVLFGMELPGRPAAAGQRAASQAACGLAARAANVRKGQQIPRFSGGRRVPQLCASRRVRRVNGVPRRGHTELSLSRR